MEQANSIKSESSNASFNVQNDNNTTLGRHPLVEGGLTFHPPFRYAGGNLGLGVAESNPFIYFVDATGARFETHSVEWLLRHIEYFEAGRSQVQLLASAGIHYGLDVYALMGADFVPKWDVVSEDGNVLLAGVSHLTASIFADEYAEEHGFGPAYNTALTIRRVSRHAGDGRHEGPLVLLHHNLGVTDFEGVAVKSHVGRCGMMLEEVLWRLDQFSESDQAELLVGLAKHFDMGQAPRETAGAA